METGPNVLLLVLVPLLALLQLKASTIVSKLSSLSVKMDSRQSALLNELQKLKSELSRLHMVDEFAKYAKTERRINAIRAKLALSAEDHQSQVSAASRAFKIAFYTVLGLVTLFVLPAHYNDPILVLPYNVDYFHPVSWLVSFPSGRHNAVGLPIWMMVSRVTVKHLFSKA